MTGMPDAFASASEAAGVLLRLMNRLLKSTFPSINPSGGINTLSTSELTTLPNAAPRMTAMARSSTLPLIAKSLNSFNITFLYIYNLWNKYSMPYLGDGTQVLFGESVL